MHLQSGSNSFDLTIIDYEYPEIVDSEYDSNWLSIEVAVTSQQGRWCFCQSCLLVWEASAIPDYLDQLAAGVAPERALAFAEPLLFFAKKSNNELKITFDAEAMPPWLEDDEGNLFSLEFSLSAESLREAATSLRKQLARFPQRAGANHPNSGAEFTVLHVE